MEEWKVFQMTYKQFSDKIVRAGKMVTLACSDMVSAYKVLPVCKKQGRLQDYRFLGKEFADLRYLAFFSALRPLPGVSLTRSWQPSSPSSGRLPLKTPS